MMRVLVLFLLALPLSAQCASATGLGVNGNAGAGSSIAVSSIAVSANCVLVLEGLWCEDVGCNTTTSSSNITSLACTGETTAQKIVVDVSSAAGIHEGLYLYTIVNTVGGTETCTLSLSGTPFYAELFVSQLPNGYRFDVCGWGASSSNTPIVITGGNNVLCTSGTATLAQSNEFLITLANTSGTLTVPAGFSALNTLNTHSIDAGLTGGTGGSTYTATWSNSVTANWQSLLSAWQPPSAHSIQAVIVVGP